MFLRCTAASVISSEPDKGLSRFTLAAVSRASSECLISIVEEEEEEEEAVELSQERSVEGL